MSSPLAHVRTDHTGRGILLTLVTISVFGIQDAVAKLLVQDYSPFQVAMLRYWGFAVFALWMVARQAPLRQALRSRAPGLQILRGVMLVTDIWLFAIALQTVPLGELQAISMVYPLLVTLFAIPLLGEKVGVFRLAAVGAGFLGALIIVRPGGVPLDWGAGAAVAAAVCYALYIVITRKVTAVDSAATTMTYTALVGLVLSFAVGVFFWQNMAWVDVLLVLVVTVTTCTGHWLMTTSLSLAPASVLQPFNYFALPWAIVLSIVIFGQWIDPISLVGAAIIVGAGLVVMARERLKRVPVVADPRLPGQE
jgi:drug/metabolite transporter (DMT)-like permease